MASCSYLHSVSAVSEETQQADMDDAFRDLIKTAETGDIGAQVKVCDAYYNGDGIEKSWGQAFQWCYKAALQNNSYAQTMIAYMYSWGEGVDRNQDKANEWTRKGANSGNITAQFSLGQEYCSKARTMQSQYPICYALLSLAVKVRSGLVGDKLNMTTKEMNEDEIEEGKNLAEEMAKPNNLLNAIDEYEKNHQIQTNAKNKK